MAEVALVANAATVSTSNPLPVTSGSGPTSQQIQGNVAAASADSGNPVKIGGVFLTALPTLTNGQRGNVQITSTGILLSSTALISAAGADGTSNTLGFAASVADGTTARLAANVTYHFNETTWDRVRGNTEGTVLPSAARTASINSADLVNYNARGVQVIIDATAIVATPSITVTIKGKDSLSGKYYTLLASAAITTVSTTLLTVYPGVTATANVAASQIIPRTWRVEVVAADADSITYSIGVNYVV